MSSLFQHFTCGFQQLSKDFTTNSYQVQTYAKNSTTVFQATAQPISAFPLVCNHCSAYFSSLPRVFMHFFHFQDWFSSFFFLPFFVTSTFIIVSLFFTFYVHPFLFRHHLLSFWHCLYMAFIVIYLFINFDHL